MQRSVTITEILNVIKLNGTDDVLEFTKGGQMAGMMRQSVEEPDGHTDGRAVKAAE